MSEHIRLSLWFQGHSASEMLPRLASSVEALPSEAMERGVRQLSVTGLDWSEPAVIEERFETGIAVATALEQMREFVHDDCACEIELAWLLWTFQDGVWKQLPQPVVFTCLGERFGEGIATEVGHLTVDFGFDEAFLAELAPWNPDTRRHLQANILQLLAYSHKLQQKLQPKRRRLWSDEQDDWTQKLTHRLQAAEQATGQPLQ